MLWLWEWYKHMFKIATDLGAKIEVPNKAADPIAATSCI
jgi:hypothetical protein